MFDFIYYKRNGEWWCWDIFFFLLEGICIRYWYYVGDIAGIGYFCIVDGSVK